MPSIDEIFRSGLESHRITPGPQVWEGLASALGAPDGKAVLPWYYQPRKTLALALAISLLSFGVGYFMASLGHGAHEGQMPALSDAHPDLQPVEQPYTFTQDYRRGMGQSLAPVTPSGPTRLTTSALLDPSHTTAFAPGPFEAQVPVGSSPTQGQPTTLAFVHSRLTAAIAAMPMATTQVQLPRQPLFELPKEVSAALAPRHIVAIGFNANQGISGFNAGIEAGATVLGRTEEYWIEQHNALQLTYGYFVARNLAILGGIAINDRYLQLSGHGLMVDTDPGSSLEYRDRVSAYRYRLGYSSRQMLLPLAVRLAGSHGFMGYHVDLGGFAQMGLGSNRQFEVSDADWSAIREQYPNDIYFNPLHVGSFVSVGLEAHLTRHLGLQMEAVLRKRFAKVALPYHAFNALEQGVQLGMFYRF